jgi:hypothetical protein
VPSQARELVDVVAGLLAGGRHDIALAFVVKVQREEWGPVDDVEGPVDA